MRIDLASVDREQFTLKEGVFCGILSILVTPAMQGTKWTQANKHLRSSIWDLSGNLLSAGFPKFTNAGENPEHFPMPKSLDGATVVNKLDGSLTIFDWAIDQLSCRTRGTFSYVTLDNAADFTQAIAKYPKTKMLAEHVPEVSWLFEITTPNQRIVIDYGPEIELTLIGGVNKRDYRLLGQDVLDSMARSYDLRRPRYFSFSSLDHLLSDVKTWQGLEGCVIYSEAGLHKAKADAYLRSHRFKERVTLPNTLDLWFAQGKPDYEVFKSNLLKTFDHECFILVETFCQRISNAWIWYQCKVAQASIYVEAIRSLSRRDAAVAIQAIYPDLWSGVAFKLLDKREIDDKMLRKLIEHELDKGGMSVTI